MMKMPAKLRGACLNSFQSKNKKDEVMAAFNTNKLHILYMSPERLFIENIDYSKVSLIVIDEAHCASEWSHNFRPSYLRLEKVLNSPKIKGKLLLATTATATPTTQQSIMKIFDIKEIVKETNISRSNLRATVTRDNEKEKFEALTTLLRSPRFSKLKSIIVYCTYKMLTHKISYILNVNTIISKTDLIAVCTMQD